MDLELKLTILTKKSRIMKVGEDIKKKISIIYLTPPPLYWKSEKTKEWNIGKFETPHPMLQRSLFFD